MTTPQEIHLAWKTGAEIALIDLREEFHFARGHPLFAACLPLGRLEIGIYDALPRRDVPIVVYDDGEGFAATGRQRLTDLGYTNVQLLVGGLTGWRAAGLELFEDVNSPSKAFGELVESRRDTPFVRAPDLQRSIDANENLVILDSRPFREYQTMTIPGAVSVPGAELVLRARTVAPDPATRIVVNCAGRTRSIIGAQSLINAGLPNPVSALRNGTIGWTLEGQALAYEQENDAGDFDPETFEAARRGAEQVAYRAGVRWIDGAALQALETRNRTVYKFDVRTQQEFEAGRPAGFRHAPGGQLVQETDMFAPVRGAFVVLHDPLRVRADMTASWLAQMGWRALVLSDASALPMAEGAYPAEPVAIRGVAEIDAGDFQSLTPVPLVLDFATSAAYAKGHIPGARFIMRSRLAQDLGSPTVDQPIVLVSPDDRLARHAAPQVRALSERDPLVLSGGTDAWRAAGGTLEQGFENALSPIEDLYRRPYEGTDNPRDKMQAYLDWEYGLVAQLERDGSHGFFVI